MITIPLKSAAEKKVRMNKVLCLKFMYQNTSRNSPTLTVRNFNKAQTTPLIPSDRSTRYRYTTNTKSDTKGGDLVTLSCNTFDCRPKESSTLQLTLLRGDMYWYPGKMIPCIIGRFWCVMCGGRSIILHFGPLIKTNNAYA